MNVKSRGWNLWFLSLSLTLNLMVLVIVFSVSPDIVLLLYAITVRDIRDRMKVCSSVILSSCVLLLLLLLQSGEGLTD